MVGIDVHQKSGIVTVHYESNRERCTVTPRQALSGMASTSTGFGFVQAWQWRASHESHLLKHGEAGNFQVISIHFWQPPYSTCPRLLFLVGMKGPCLTQNPQC